jgi:hypothetical protein
MTCDLKNLGFLVTGKIPESGPKIQDSGFRLDKDRSNDPNANRDSLPHEYRIASRLLQ